VNNTYYCINGGRWEIYIEPFRLSEDGNDILIEYYSMDFAGNVEDVKSFTIAIDHTEPYVCVYWELISRRPVDGWKMIGSAIAIDDTSGMDRVEFFWDLKLRDIDIGTGPDYVCDEFIFTCDFSLKGYILNPMLTEEYVRFRALILILTDLPEIVSNRCDAYDNAGNKGSDEEVQPFSPPDLYIDGFVLFRRITLPNNYTGTIGRFFIDASFDIS
jgi:hypothetical protein